jgi:5-bromo-4-chloroindolyl phosphate hydrolysis protein
MSKAKRYDASKKNISGLTGILLYLLPTPILLAIIISFFGDSGISIIKYGVAYGLFILAAVVAKKGFTFEKLYKDSALAKAPRLPYKSVAALLLAIATFYTSLFCVDNTLFFSFVISLSSLFGFYLFYGFDPRSDKVGDLRVGVRAEDVIATTNDAKAKVESLKDFKTQIKDLKTKEHLDDIIKETESLITSIEKAPNDLSKARKFFKIYLDRVGNITGEFVTNLKAGNINDELSSNYDELLVSMKKTIKEQKEKLNDDDILSLDIQIEALAKQLNHEGV